MSGMMEDSIARFGEQFDWEPAVENAGALGGHERYIVCGMGGSALAPWLIKHYGAKSGSLMFHREYGLPLISEEVLKSSLIILSSYSGNTEEVLDSGRNALEHGFTVAAITTGGKLLDFAREHGLPYVQMPEMNLQPRMAIGLSMLGIAKLMESADLEASIRTAGKAVSPLASKEEGSRIAAVLADKVPLVYSSAANLPLAYIWKIKFNETAKIPAFYNAFPELCHNELSGFDVVGSTRGLLSNMHVVLLEDATDHSQIQKRMQITGDVLRDRGVSIEYIKLVGEGFEKAFNNAILADWVSFNLARHYGVPDEETPLITDFKRRMAE